MKLTSVPLQHCSVLILLLFVWFTKMAEASILLSEAEFCCSICLDLLKDPVTLACGHSFCMSCVSNSWDQQFEIYSCPQCRETFYTRPVLHRNNMLAGVVEKLRKTGPQLSDSCYAKSGDVECDICTAVKRKAVKSCLVCLASYCEAHFRPHKESSALMKHTAIEASTKLQEKICPQHGKALEVFCRTDQKCICYLCTLDEHSSHNTVSAMAERAEKEKQVVETQNKYTARILEREGYCQELEKSVESLKDSARVAVKDTEKMFHELIQSVEKKCSEVTNHIRAQEKAELNRTEEHLKKVKQEIVDLKSESEELKQLSQIQDDILYFQIFQAFHDFILPKAIPRVNINMPHSYEDVKIFVHKLKEQIEHATLYPDSSSKMNTQVTCHYSQNTWHPKKKKNMFSSNPATESPKSSFVTHTKTPAESIFSKPTTLSQSKFGLSSAPSNRGYLLFESRPPPSNCDYRNLLFESPPPSDQRLSLFESPPPSNQRLHLVESPPPSNRNYRNLLFESPPPSNQRLPFL